MPMRNFIERSTYAIVLCLILLSSCKEGIFKSGLKEGEIEYEVSYPALPKDHLMMDLLPKKMECKFSQGQYRNEISAGMGLFRSAIVYQGEEDHLYHTVKLLNKKIYAELNKNDILTLNEGFNGLVFEETGERKTIAGYDCKEVEVTVPGDSVWIFNVYYTNEIDIPKANYRNPFESLDGVLMEYDILSNDLHMHFKATRVTETEVDEKDIKISSDYNQVSSEELRKELESIFNKVK
jgi:GLPGLI family protein